MTRALVPWVFERLLGAYGPQHWWPARTPFEVMVGAVLTQNTAWVNVERAVAALSRAGLLRARALAGLRPERLAEFIRPAGTPRVKARRLQALCAWLLGQGGRARASRRSPAALRASLLAVHGVGPETADAILLYAFGVPVFVVDAYTRRVFSRLGAIGGHEPYESLRAWLQSALPAEVGLLNEYHALIVEHAKRRCRARAPLCEGCCLARRCAGARGERRAGRPQGGLRVPGPAAKLARR